MNTSHSSSRFFLHFGNQLSRKAYVLGVLVALQVSSVRGAVIPTANPPAAAAGAANVTPGNAVAAASDQGPVVLSSFQVNTSRDVGYIAGDSLSGSRLNTSLRDTAAQISVFTQEFISDLGANNMAEVMQYAANFQVDVDDASAAMAGAFYVGVQGETADTRFRIRNIRGSRAIDFFTSQIANDNYNVDRFEAVSGPNAILFGFGSPGGIVNTTTKTALLNRDVRTIRIQAGSWKQLRSEVDLNQVIAKDRFALRVMGLAESGDTWRKWGFKEQKRGTVSATYQPFKGTLVRALYERGNSKKHIEVPNYNAFDGYALWDSRGRPTKDGYAAATDRPQGVSQITAVRHVLIENSNSYQNTQGRLTSTFEDLALPVAQRAGNTLLSEEQFPFDISVSGPGANLWQKFHQGRVFLEHKISDKLVAEVVFNKMWNYDWTYTPGNLIAVQGDPNRSLIPNSHSF